MPSEWTFVWQRSTGSTVRNGDLAVTPVARNAGLRWPGGGLVWSFPVSVEIARGETVETEPIVDVTRMAMIALWFGTVLTLWLVRILRRDIP